MVLHTTVYKHITKLGFFGFSRFLWFSACDFIYNFFKNIVTGNIGTNEVMPLFLNLI